MNRQEHKQIIQNFLNMVTFDTQGKGCDCGKLQLMLDEYFNEKDKAEEDEITLIKNFYYDFCSRNSLNIFDIIHHTEFDSNTCYCIVDECLNKTLDLNFKMIDEFVDLEMECGDVVVGVGLLGKDEMLSNSGVSVM